METIEKESLLYGFINYSLNTGNSGPRELLSPVIYKSINTIGKSNFTLAELQTAVKLDFGSDLDLLLIRAEINNIMHSGKINYNTLHRHYELTTEFDKEKYNEDYSISKDNNDIFIRELKKYIDSQTTHYKSLTYSRIFKYLTKYIEDNFSEILIIIADMNVRKGNVSSNGSGIHEFIEKFIYQRVLTDDKLYISFENIFNGIVLLYIYRNCPKLFKKDNPFGEKMLFLDTNIVLRILGLQDYLGNQMGKELLTYISIPNFEIAITNETWEEMFSLITGYTYCYKKIVKNGKVNHVYQSMKDSGIDPDNIGEYISRIKTKLSEIGIEIKDSQSILFEEKGDEELHIQELAKRKYEHKCEQDGTDLPFEEIDKQRYLRQSKHDIINVYNIKKLRVGKKIRLFRDVKFYFITADYILRKYSKEKFRSGDQPLLLSDSSLAFLLYYNNPNTTKSFSMNSFINAHFNSKRLSIKNWIEFYDIVKKKITKGEIDKSQAGYLLTHAILSNDNFDSGEIDEIIVASIDEFNEKMKSSSEERRHLSKLNNEKDKEIEKYSEKVTKLEDKVDSLVNKTDDISDENVQLKQDMIEEKSKNKKQRNQFIILCIIFLSIGLYLIFSGNLIFGGITTFLSIVFFIYDFIIRFIDKNK